MMVGIITEQLFGMDNQPLYMMEMLITMVTKGMTVLPDQPKAHSVITREEFAPSHAGFHHAKDIHVISIL